MNEKEILISHFADKINFALNNSMIASTDFLSVEERADISFLLQRYNKEIDFYWFGGYEDAERTVAFIVPKYFCTEGNVDVFLRDFPDSNSVATVKLTKDRFSAVGHRDYLGALMGLGIKRKLIGNILVFDWGAYIFVADSIKGFICDNLRQCGKATVRCEAVSYDSVSLPEDKFEILFHSVASMRLDNILSAGFGLSRSNCTEAISSGLVFVNSVRAEKNDMHIYENDKIVLRGKGKIVIDNIIGKNKKDRIHINIKHYK